MYFHSVIEFSTILLTFISSALAFLIFTRRIILKNKTRIDIFFYLSMLCISIWRFGDGLSYLKLFNIIAWSPKVISVAASVAYFYTCPLMYFYIRYFISGDEEINTTIMLHLIAPTLLTILLFLVVIAAVFANDFSLSIKRFDTLLIVAATIVNCLYALIVLIKMILLLIQGKNRLNRLFILNSAIIILIIGTILTYLIGNKFLLSVLFVLVLSLFFVFGSWFYTSLQIIKDEASRGKYAKSQIKDLDVDGIVKRMENLISKEKIYRDDEISLKSFSEKLQLTAHQLSEILNTRLGMSFFNYINNYRINEACDLLEYDRDASIIQVAYQVGFNSLSSFYTAFKKNTGISPGKYQKLIIK